VIVPHAALLIPELRWDPHLAFTHLSEAIDDLLELGVGGFLIRGGTRDDVAALTGELHRRSAVPLLIAADVPRGAGGAIDGLTGLPPAAALAALRDDDVVRRAARITARDLRSVGINWAIGPRADLANELRNPFLGVDAFSADAQRAAEWLVAWSDACQAEGVLATALHYPGVGRALDDPTLGASSVREPRDVMWGSDLVPFRAMADSGVATLLAAQVSYPRLDASGAPAARSPLLLGDWLRGELQYEGLIVSDTYPAKGSEVSEGDAAAQAIAAGADLVLAPSDIDAVLDGIEALLRSGALTDDALDDRLRRRAFWAHWGRPGAGREVTLDDVLWARQVADTVTHVVRGAPANVAGTVDVILVDDARKSGLEHDVASRLAPMFGTFRATDVHARAVTEVDSSARESLVLVVIAGAESGRGSPQLSDDAARRVAEITALARQAKRVVHVVLMGPPHLAAAMAEVSAPNVLCAWSADRAMQEAAARRLV
jgi:beta-glucosidase-like glycosyl hydrolase